jgi:hypothetical protein
VLALDFFSNTPVEWAIRSIKAKKKQVSNCVFHNGRFDAKVCAHACTLSHHHAQIEADSDSHMRVITSFFNALQSKMKQSRDAGA